MTTTAPSAVLRTSLTASSAVLRTALTASPTVGEFPSFAPNTLQVVALAATGIRGAVVGRAQFPVAALAGAATLGSAAPHVRFPLAALEVAGTLGDLSAVVPGTGETAPLAAQASFAPVASRTSFPIVSRVGTATVAAVVSRASFPVAALSAAGTLSAAVPRASFPITALAGEGTLGAADGVPASAYDTDAAAYIAAVEAADVASLETGVKDAINDLVVALKAASLWAKIDAAGLLCGPRTLAGLAVALKGPSVTLNNFVSGDYHRENGLLGNASNKEIGTGHVFASGRQDDVHAGAYSHTAGTGGFRTIIGNGDASTLGYVQIARDTTSNRLTYRVMRGAGIPYITAPTTNIGFIGGTRTSSTTITAWADAQSQSISQTSLTPEANAVAVFSRGGSSYTDDRLQFWAVGAYINDTDWATYRGLVADYIADVGAAI